MPKLVSALPCNGLGTEQRHLATFDLYFCARCAATARVWLCFSFCPWSVWRCEPGVCAHAWSSGNNNLTKRGIPALNLFAKVSIQFKRSRKGMLKAKQVLLYQLSPWDREGVTRQVDGTVACCTCPAWAGRCSRSHRVGEAVVLFDFSASSTSAAIPGVCTHIRAPQVTAAGGQMV